MATYKVYGRTMGQGRITSHEVGEVEEKPTFREERDAALELLRKAGYVWGGWESRHGWRSLETKLDAAVGVCLRGAIYFDGGK